jgi:predicted MFS family arabinose efflux permease
VAVRRLVAESRATVAVSAGRPDVGGALLATAGLVSAVYGLISAASVAWGSVSVVVPIVVGVLFLAAFVLREHTASKPLVPLRFFTNRTRVAANVVTLCFASVFFTLFFLLTLYLQQVEHFSALRTGVAYLPFGVAISAGIGVSSKLVTKVGVRTILGVGFVLGAAGMLAFTAITAGGSFLAQVLPGELLVGLGSGLCFAGFANASVHGVSGEDASLASGVQNAVQQVGGAIGLAVLATLALRHADTAVSHGVAVATASTGGTVIAYRVGAVILAVGALATWTLMERAGSSSEGVEHREAASLSFGESSAAPQQSTSSTP